MKLVETVHAIDEWSDPGMTRFRLGIMDPIERAQWLNEGCELFTEQATAVCRILRSDGKDYSQIDQRIQQIIALAEHGDNLRMFGKLVELMETMFRVVRDNYADPDAMFQREVP